MDNKAIGMMTPDGVVLRERDAYTPTGEPKGDGPRCATCGDLAAWGLHCECKTGDDIRKAARREFGRGIAGAWFN